MKLDVHVHLAGVGTQESGCWMSPAFQRRLTFRILRWWHRITTAQILESVDQDWAGLIAERVAASELDRAVVLGFDGVYDERGELDRARSQMIIPPAWVFAACERHPEHLLPGPSIHPLRRDALERLDECAERGAVLLKWLPATQGIDPSSPRLRDFYRRMRDHGLPLLVHSGGGELTFAEVAPELSDLELLRTPLDAGVTVICAHSATRVHVSRDPDQLPLLRRLLREYPHLWVDNSGLANPSRFAHLPRLARDPEIHERTLYGSDFPVPSNAFYYLRRLGPRRVAELERERNPFDRDIRIKRYLGYPDATLSRAARVLRPGRWLRSALGLALATATLAGASPATAQLRPLEPVAWRALTPGTSFALQTGVGLHQGQRASLAGTTGRLLELANFQTTWRSGRFALELGGTVLRLFEDDSTFAPPHGGADPAVGSHRRDSGDYRVGTILLLTPPARDAAAILRFGTRLPTTDNRVGLDRDRTDFFALLGGRIRRGPLSAAAEAGLGIFGTHDPRYEQADVLVYGLSAEYRLPHVAPTVALVGHSYLTDFSIRGNEALRELRVGSRLGGRYWVQILGVRGFTEFSPGWGVLLSAGLER